MFCTLTSIYSHFPGVVSHTENKCEMHEMFIDRNKSNSSSDSSIFFIVLTSNLIMILLYFCNSQITILYM